MTENPKVRIKVGPFYFDCSSPYSAGHVLTSVEANILNQSRRDNIRNLMARRLEKTPSISEADALAQFLLLDENYEFSIPIAKDDPVLKHARTLAMDMIKAAANKHGIDLATIPQAKIEEQISELIDTPEIQHEARHRASLAAEIATKFLE